MTKDDFEPKAYAFKIYGGKREKICQSGGAFTALAEKVLEDGGIVYGVSYERPYAKYTRVDNRECLFALAGSKYVQAKLDCFKEIEKDLKAGLEVLFSGTPCYCNAVQKYCVTKGIRTERLFTIEFLCHGVPSPELFRCWLQCTEDACKIKSQDFRFRDKTIDGWGGYYSSMTISRKIIITSENWLNVFHSDRYFRESCYNCQYTTKKRVSDITIGDLWNINQIDRKIADVCGVSMVLFNSMKGYTKAAIFKTQGLFKEVLLEDMIQPPMCKPTDYREDGIELDWNDSFESNVEKIVERYHEPNIIIFHGIPMTGSIRFWKKYVTYRIKRGKFFAIMKRLIL